MCVCVGGGGYKKAGVGGRLYHQIFYFYFFFPCWLSLIKFIDWLFFPQGLYFLCMQQQRYFFFLFKILYVDSKVHSKMETQNNVLLEKKEKKKKKTRCFPSMHPRSLFFIWIVQWSGKMEHVMERTSEWDSHGQMEPSSANYCPVQLIPMVT